MLIAQITDMHISRPGRRAHDVYRTSQHLERWVARLNAHEPRPDLVLATGDLVNDGEAEEYERLAALLAGLEMPLYLIPGNHDSREAMRAVFPAHRYLGACGYMQYVVDDYPVRLIGLDTLKPGTHAGELCEARLAWLAERLAEAPEKPTLIFMHHPPFRTGIPSMDAYGLDGTERFRDVIRGYGNIERIVAGHLHRPVQQRVGNTVASTAPATAHQLALRFRQGERLIMTFEPPACQLHCWLGAEDGLVSHTIYLDEAVIPPGRSADDEFPDQAEGAAKA
jgi:3',5'-cyclic-AMP phosphodiesterase